MCTIYRWNISFRFSIHLMNLPIACCAPTRPTAAKSLPAELTQPKWLQLSGWESRPAVTPLLPLHHGTEEPFLLPVWSSAPYLLPLILIKSTPHRSSSPSHGFILSLFSPTHQFLILVLNMIKDLRFRQKGEEFSSGVGEKGGVVWDKESGEGFLKSDSLRLCWIFNVQLILTCSHSAIFNQTSRTRNTPAHSQRSSVRLSVHPSQWLHFNDSFLQN